MQALYASAKDETAHTIDSLVTMAKAEALDDMGEHRVSVLLVERLLSKSKDVAE